MSFRQRKNALVFAEVRTPVLAPPLQLVRPRIRRAFQERCAAAASAAISRASTLVPYLRRQWPRALLLGIVGIVVHSPALQGQRIWDDQYLSYENPFIKSPLLVLEVFWHYLFLDSLSAHYRPVQNISFIVDYFFWSTNEFGFHLTNVLLHAGSAVLLYFLLRQLFTSLCVWRRPLSVRARALRRMPWISHGAFMVALLWIVHPVHSAAVDYISGRADSLAFFFAAAGWLLSRRDHDLSRATAIAGTAVDTNTPGWLDGARSRHLDGARAG